MGLHATAMRTEPTLFAGRDSINPQTTQDAAKAVYKGATSRIPRKEIDCTEIYVPFSWFEPM